jgi:hypothetical protein
MKLKEKLRQNLTGQLSDEKTEVDVNIAEKIAEEFAIGFADWMRGFRYDNAELYFRHSTKELLEIYKKEKGL